MDIYERSKIQKDELYDKVNNKESIYIVFQGKTYDLESKGEFIWAPLCSDNRNVHHWERMGELKKGDVIFHCVKRYIMAISEVIEEAIIAPYPGEAYEEYGNGQYIKCKYTFLLKPISLDMNIDEILIYGNYPYSPFNKKGGCNEGYLFELNKILAGLFLK